MPKKQQQQESAYKNNLIIARVREWKSLNALAFQCVDG